MNEGDERPAKTLSLGDLIPGDVLLYYRDTLLGWAMRKIDGTPVTHAALYLGEGRVAEAIGRGLVSQQVQESLGPHPSDYILVRRRSAGPAVTAMDPVLKTASRFLDSHVRYAHDEIILLAFLGTTRRLTLTPKLRILLRRVLDRAAALLLKAIRGDGQETLICSEFVYRCFADTAEQTGDDAYSIQIAGLAWGRGIALGAGAVRAPQEGSLLDRARGTWDQAARGGLPGLDGGDGGDWSEPPTVSTAEVEEAVRAYQAELTQGPLERGFGGDSDDDELLAAMQRFVRALDGYQRVEKGERSAFDADSRSVPSWQEVLAVVGNFVTPGDLFNSATLTANGRLVLGPQGATPGPDAPKEDSPPTTSVAPRDHVLLIGIDDYSIQPLRGCVNDVLAVRELLQQRFGVSASAMTVLASPAPGRQVEGALPASMAELRDAFDQLDSDAVAPGDRVIIYYSGHGGSRRIEGQSLRHFVECLVPVDYSAKAGGPLLYDAEMNRRLAGIARRTSNVTVILDCCHSQGATRGSFLAEADAARALSLPSLHVPAAVGQALPAGIDLGGATRELKQPHPQALIVAASLADEAALETTDGAGKRHGVLTRSLLSTLRANARDATWKEVWTPILQAARPRQNPVLIGDDNRAIFSDVRSGDRGELPVEPDGEEFRVGVGTLVDITPGTRIAVYGSAPPVLPAFGAAEERARAGTLVVVEAELSSARARADRSFLWPAGARCRVATFGNSVLTVCFDAPPSAAVLDRLAADSSIRLVAPENAEVRLRPVDGSWVLCDDLHGLAIRGQPELVRCTDEDLPAVLRRYIRYRAPLRLAARSTDILGALDLRLLDARQAPADPQAPELPDLESVQSFRYGLRIGQPFCMVAENRSSSALRSVALLNCGSSGKVQHLAAFGLPARALHALWLGEELGVPFRLGGPTGIERLVLIGSTKPDVDWRFLETDVGFRQIDRDFGTTRDFARPRARDLYTATTVAVRVLAEV